MKKVIILFILLAGVTWVMADSIKFSRHNLTLKDNRVYQTTTDRICVFCHTPHGGHRAEEVAPLWNRKLPVTGTYQMYYSPTIETNLPERPDGISLACLSCHDGSIAIDAMINRPGSMGYNKMNPVSAGYEFRGGPETDKNTLPEGDKVKDKYTQYPEEEDRITNLTQDLRDDHPISMVYPIVNNTINALDPKFNDPGPDHIFDNGIKLFGLTDNTAKVQCASCHNPHNPAYGTFLRAPREICATCHIK